MESLQKEYDAIVVGSGPGGATVAKELSQNGKKVLILEWGSNAPIKGSMLQCLSMTGVTGKSLLVTNKKMLLLIRGITTGGSTIYYYATSWPVPLERKASQGFRAKNNTIRRRNRHTGHSACQRYKKCRI